MGRPAIDLAATATSFRRSPRKKSQTNSSIALKEIELPETDRHDTLELAITSAQRARGGKGTVTTTTAKPTKKSHQSASQFISREANCVDDYSDDAEVEEEDTDLSGFIVDDDAEISFHCSSDDDPDSELEIVATRKITRSRLRRGHRKSTLTGPNSDKENDATTDLASAMDGLDISQPGAGQHRNTAIEISDSDEDEKAPGMSQGRLDTTNPGLQTRTTSRKHSIDSAPSSRLSSPHHNEAPDSRLLKSPRTPPRTPSPPRLKSHSNLFSPSLRLSPTKRNAIPKSPHRESIDAFWDHDEVNSWNDAHSPKKAPAESPKKNPFSQFQIWSDGYSDARECEDYNSSDSAPSPCASPTKRSRSPMKSPEKTARAAYLAEKRESAARKKAFDAVRASYAADLLSYLDEHLTEGKLAEWSASKGGLKITWSKLLRTTAGIAKWKRFPLYSKTVVPGCHCVRKESSGMHLHLEHDVTVELGEKVIDSEERLINTLSHEFCHLADMVFTRKHASRKAGDPKPKRQHDDHGKDWHAWVEKTLTCLRSAKVGADDPRIRRSWNDVHISVKHDYEIDYKYVWLCAGRSRVQQQHDGLPLLGTVGEDACGMEYSRHSKSINPDKDRCGKCKGWLLQVRPVPIVRTGPSQSPRKKSAPVADPFVSASASPRKTSGGRVPRNEVKIKNKKTRRSNSIVSISSGSDNDSPTENHAKKVLDLAAFMDATTIRK
jgi:hypothetical protein